MSKAWKVAHENWNWYDLRKQKFFTYNVKQKLPMITFWFIVSNKLFHFYHDSPTYPQKSIKINFLQALTGSVVIINNVLSNWKTFSAYLAERGRTTKNNYLKDPVGVLFYGLLNSHDCSMYHLFTKTYWK